jgi:hypothetical protein
MYHIDVRVPRYRAVGLVALIAIAAFAAEAIAR